MRDQRISIVRVDEQWHAFTTAELAWSFYAEWRDYRECELVADIPTDVDVSARLEYLRSQLDAQCISMGELIELQGLADYIEPGDVQLAEAAGIDEQEFARRGVPEFVDSDDREGWATDVERNAGTFLS